MPSSLPLHPYSPSDRTISLAGLSFSATERRPRIVQVKTETSRDGTARSPRSDLLLAQHRLQPYIHDTKICVEVGRSRKITFHVFVKRGRRLPENRQLSSSMKIWRGDVLVMKVGCPRRNGNTLPLVSLVQKKDRELARWAIKRFVSLVNQKKPFRFPRSGFVFRKS